MKTYSPKPEHIQRRWYVLDASEQVLGRLASEAAHILRGKHKPIYAPHADVGDHVIVVNASKVVLTGGKERTKVAYRHSGHPGGITATVYGELLARRPAFAVEKAVRGMLPKNRLGRAMIKKLHVEAGPEHRHQAQKPEAWAIGSRPAWEGLARTAPESPGGSRAETGATRPASGRKTTATKAAPAKRTAPSKKPTAKKPTATKKPTAARKTTAAKAATGTRKTTAAKTTARKTTSKKTTARKPTASKKREA